MFLAARHTKHVFFATNVKNLHVNNCFWWKMNIPMPRSKVAKDAFHDLKDLNSIWREIIIIKRL